MSDLRILVVEDSRNWQEALPRILQRLAGDGSTPNPQVDIAGNYRVALNNVSNHTYDLAIVDLALLGDPTDPQDSDQLGMELLRDLRNSRFNRGCGLIVLTGYPTTGRTRQALRDYAAYDFIDKSEFDGAQFIETARAAILDARLRQATVKASARYYLTINVSQQQLLGCTFTGPDHRSNYTAEHPESFPIEALIGRTETLTTLLTGSQQNRLAAWQRETPALGDAIYDALGNDRRIFQDLSIARAKIDRPDKLWLQFSGPVASLGVPFEILRYEAEEYLGLRHILTRQLIQAGVRRTSKPEPLRMFIDDLRQRGEPLRILMVNVNAASDEYLHTTPPSSSPDIYAVYEAVLVELLNRLDSTHVRFTEALVYQQRLTENVAQARRHGDTETRRAERSQIIDLLNGLASVELGLSFNELCQQITPSTSTTQAERVDNDNVSVVQHEATHLTTVIKTQLQCIGIACEITELTGADATYDKISNALRNGRHHLFHYASHGNPDALLPEMGELTLHHNSEPATMTADNLKLLVQDTDLRLVFLSCYWGAKASTFQDMLAALVRADVPAVLGYRWAIPDEAARHLAAIFYQELWRNFSPGEALFEARRTVAREKNGGDINAWASPVLVMQNI